MSLYDQMFMSYSMASRVSSSSSSLSPSSPFSSSVSSSSSSPQLPSYSSSLIWAQPSVLPPPVQLRPVAPESSSSPSNLPAEQWTGSTHYRTSSS